MKRLALVLTMLTTACAAGSELPPGLQCEGDGECHDGLVCSFNYCVDGGRNELVLMARVSPPPSTGLLPQQVPQLSTYAGPDLLVQLLPSVHIQGVITKRGEPAVTSWPGELEVRSVDVISGFEHRFTATASNGISEDALYGFDLVVLPGRSYEGVFRPTDPSTPRARFVLTAEQVASGRFDLELPAKSEYVTISGRVRRAETEQPVTGARIVVLSPDAEVLGITATDDIRGVFELQVAPDVDQVLIKVSAADGKAFADFTTDPVSVDDEIIVDLPGQATLLPAVAALRVVDPDGVAVPGLTVTVVGHISGGSLRRSAVTDAYGVARLDILPALYECLVIVPPERPYGTWHGPKELTQVSNSTVEATIQLEPRARLAVHVRDAFGADVGAAEVTLERRNARADDDALVVDVPARTLDLDALGAAAALVDPGTYDLTITPDPSTGAPNTNIDAVVVDEEGLALDVELPTPGLLHLTVADPSNAYMPDVSVELWQPRAGASPRLLARATTGARGYIDVLVPHEHAGAAALHVDER